HDRFLLRFVVDYLSEDFRFLKLLQSRPSGPRTTLPLEALDAARAEAASLSVPGEVLRAITDVRRELRAKGLTVSDRRYAQAVGVLRAHAYEDEVRVLLFQSRELRDYALRSWDSRELQSRATLEAHTKIRSILGKVD